MMERPGSTQGRRALVQPRPLHALLCRPRRAVARGEAAAAAAPRHRVQAALVQEGTATVVRPRPQQAPDHVSLVTGASRGIGLALVQELLAKGGTVVAAARNPTANGELEALAAASDGRLQLMRLDVSSTASIEECARQLGRRLQHIDLVINNAGIGEEGGLRPFEDVREQDFLNTFQVNSVAPFLITRQLRQEGLIGRPGGDSVVVNISSILGSCGAEGYGAYPGFAYRASKAALNNLTRCMDFNLSKEGVACLAMHPGYVKTDINRGAGEISAEESVQGMLAVLESGRDLHGKFLSWTGSELPW